MEHFGGCHCGAVRFAVDPGAEPVLLDCNCSICRKTGYLHLIAGEANFRLLSGQADLSEYRFGTGAARHLFCARCGIKSFYRPRSHPAGWSVNARCLDWLLDAPIRPIDGANWEAARAALD